MHVVYNDNASPLLALPSEALVIVKVTVDVEPAVMALGSKATEIVGSVALSGPDWKASWLSRRPAPPSC